ncbi:hypothetical protein K6Y31_04465 [Motilimonas cestriensis]|uniref:Capsule polysaccharide biosynthesis protein n=1 Tax=Motilimonas cestriensis TaxID=2742685 RepID=A0ABS8W8C9_9GAMM|nr:hypothetical protein [Motilimonas cestriensis]MCE2594064.1 hypothetical protein [Motilimonas cestriensis]
MNLSGIVKKIFSPYVLSNEEKEFIKLNRIVWNTKCKGSVGVLVEGFLDSPTSVVEKSRLANAAREVTGLDVEVIVRGVFGKASNVIPIYKSFGFDRFRLWWRNYFNPFVVIPAFSSFFHLLFMIRTGDALVDYKKDDIVIGDLIYDSLIRNIPNSYTVKNICIFKHGRILLRSMFFFYGNKRILKNKNVKFFVTSHNVYAEYGMLCRQAHNQGAIVLLKDMDVYKIYSKSKNVNEHFLKVEQSIVDECVRTSDLKKEKEYYRSRVLGLSEQVDIKNAYKNKKIYSKSETLALHTNFSLSKKNVFVMAHAFSDAPHVGEGLLFRDYYDFLEKTLIKLNGNSNINCFVKAHPSSYMWGEKGGVEEIVETNCLTNVCIVPSDYNTSSIIDVADVIVTAKGTAGLEFSCAGIPAITAGIGYYHGFGICYEPNTVADYYSFLMNSHQLNKLDDSVINKSLIVLYQSFNRLFHSPVLPAVQIRPGDDYQSLYRSKYSEMVTNLNANILMKDEFYDLVKSDISRVVDEE